MKGNIKQRHLSYLGLFAVLMLFLGPLTTQIIAMAAYTAQKNTPHHQQHIASQATEQSHVHHDMPQQADDMPRPMSHHDMSDCGYCDLVHSPVLFTYIPIIANAPPTFKQRIAYHTHVIFIPLYNTPLSRAPPVLS